MDRLRGRAIVRGGGTTQKDPLMTTRDRIVLILGSGPNAVAARQWARAPFTDIVAINNAWQVREDWDYLIHPEDFPEDRHPVRFAPSQRRVTYREYVPVQNDYGGFVYAGGTMAFTAGYWALGALRPRVLAFLGCDMVYTNKGDTHFYGKGEADPLRDDITLQSLEAKAARLFLLAAQQDCLCVNLSKDESRLVFPRATPARLGALKADRWRDVDLSEAQTREAELAYFEESGRYWQVRHRFDATELRRLDSLWLSTFEATRHSPRGP